MGWRTAGNLPKPPVSANSLVWWTSSTATTNRPTAYWYATWRKSLLWAAYAGIFFVASQCLRRTAGRKAFALFFTAFGTLGSTLRYRATIYLEWKLYWLVPNRDGGWVYGPYVNHAHYAGLMEMLLPNSLGLRHDALLAETLARALRFGGLAHGQHNFLVSIPRRDTGIWRTDCSLGHPDWISQAFAAATLLLLTLQRASGCLVGNAQSGWNYHHDRAPS